MRVADLETRATREDHEALRLWLRLLLGSFPLTEPLADALAAAVGTDA